MTSKNATGAALFQSLIEFADPGTVLSIGSEYLPMAISASKKALPKLAHHHLRADEATSEKLTEIRADLALVADTLEHLPHDRGVQLLGILRNVGIAQIAVTVREDAGWSFKDFIGLGFKRHGEFSADGHTVSLYTYNLASYNHKRAWNNPKYWANPEMWGKAWW